jgi:hypothetical protein
MTAFVNSSLGGVKLGPPRRRRGTIVSPAEAMTAVLIKSRRVMDRLMAVSSLEVYNTFRTRNQCLKLGSNLLITHVPLENNA